MLKAVSAVARSHGRRVMVMESDDDPSIEHDLVEDLMRSCDGVLICSSRMERADLAVLTARDHPLVLLDRIVPGLAAPAVSADFFGGMMLICGHLAQLGHRQVAYLSGPEVSWANSERIRALEAAKAFGLSVTILPCGSTSRCGYEAAAEVAGTGATALTTYNDLVALGAVTRMRELGVRVPEELSVVGFDDIALEHVAHASLTTVSAPRGQLGRQAAEMLEALMTEGHDGEPLYPADGAARPRQHPAPPRVPAVLTSEGDGGKPELGIALSQRKRDPVHTDGRTRRRSRRVWRVRYLTWSRP